MIIKFEATNQKELSDEADKEEVCNIYPFLYTLYSNEKICFTLGVLYA